MANDLRQLSTTIGRAVELMRHRGLFYVLLRAARRASVPIVAVSRVVFFVRPLKSDDAAPATAVPVAMCFATPKELPLLLEASDPRRTAEILAGRFQRGDRCLVGLDAAGAPVYTCWLSTDRGYIPELRMQVALQPGEAYYYDAYTPTKWRGLGIDGAGRRFMFAWLRAAGFDRVYCYVRGDNPVGQRAAARHQTRTGTLVALRLLGCTPLVLGRVTRPVLVRGDGRGGGEGDDAHRARVTRAWFESWCHEPVAKRSTGFHPVPDDYFASTADCLADALALDPDTDTVLDVGCDSALVSRLVARRCRQLVGVDFVPGLLVDRPADKGPASVDRRGAYAAADARFLPFRAGAFAKVYSAAMIHVLPSRDDGVKAIDEMIRVCRPGGQVLVASVPDAAKRRRALGDAWRRAGVAGKLQLVLALCLPRPLKRAWHNLVGAGWGDRIVLLDYDLAALTARIAARGHRCQVLDFPADYWSRDFRRTRSNLLITVGATAATPDPDRELLASGHGAARP